MASAAKTAPVSRGVPPKQAKAAAVAKAKAIAPDQPIRLGTTPKTKFRGDPDIFGRLVEDHDRHRALFAMLEATEPHSPDRPRLFEELVREVKAHAAAEEQALWSTIMRNPDTTDVARHAVGEHKELDKMFADLAARDIASDAWLERLASCKHEYLHHIGEEEQEQFVDSEKVLSPADLRYMRRVFTRRKREEKATVEIKKKIRLKDFG